MQRNQQAVQEFDVSALIRMLWKWKFILVGIGFVAAVVSYFYSKSITPLYESHTVLYPSNSNDRDKQLEEFTFGYEIHSERLLQLLNSDAILDSINARFDLARHYHVNLERKDWYDRFLQISRERIRFQKTQFSSVVISVVDEEPELAAKIANDIARLVNIVNANVVRFNAQNVLKAVEKEYNSRQGTVSEINDSIVRVIEGTAAFTLDRLKQQMRGYRKQIGRIRDSLDILRRDYDIYDYGHQVEVLNQQLAQARSTYLQESGRIEILENTPNTSDSILIAARAARSGAKKRVDYFEKSLNELSDINAIYTELSDRLGLQRELETQARLQYQKLDQNAEMEVETWSLNNLQQNHDWDQVQMQELKRKYQRAMSNLIDPVAAAYVVTKAHPSYIK
ncbi:MAG: Wzz/FepE/Etk N-terminal domain-containing protein, partial [Bacteroidota bacterium]